MEQKQYRLKVRRSCSIVGWTLLVIYKLLTDIISTVMVFQGMWQGLRSAWDAVIRGEPLDLFAIQQGMTESLSSNFWGYILAIGIGLLILLLWKGGAYWKEQIWARDKKMNAGSFFCLLAFMVSAQLLVQLFTPVIEWLLNQIGLSAMAALEMATINSQSLSMFLYIALLGPFAEEILFRGFVLRTLLPYGKGMAIVVSALLFGMYHGNIVQIPYAFLVGLVLAYTALEYSIFWAIVLHVFNNFVLADLMTRIGQLLPEGMIDTVFMGIIVLAAVAALIIGICRRKEIGAYARQNRIDKTAMQGFVSSAGCWVFTAAMLASAVFLLFV